MLLQEGGWRYGEWGVQTGEQVPPQLQPVRAQAGHTFSLSKKKTRQIDGHLPCLHTRGACQVSCVWLSVGCDLWVSAGLSLLTER